MKRIILICLSIFLLVGCVKVDNVPQTTDELIEETPTIKPTTSPTEEPTEPPDFLREYDGSEPEYLAVELGFDIRGVNMGNALEGPTEGEWGVTIKEEYFSLIKKAGFNLIRVPIRWSAHTGEDAPYTIDVQFMDRVKWVVDQGIANDLIIILDLHHYNELFDDPASHADRLNAIWQQIASEFHDAPDNIWFEFCNEPTSALTTGIWNEMALDILGIVRENNPDRKVIIGGGNWNKINTMSSLDLPLDQNIIITFHYYKPYGFTHQGAEWTSYDETGVPWRGLKGQKLPIEKDFDKAARISSEMGYPVFLGEFGAYGKGSYEDRVRWTTWMRQCAESRNIGWAYWEFCAGFGIYDKDGEEFYPELTRSLIEGFQQ